jgi:hypothetical protein
VSSRVLGKHGSSHVLRGHGWTPHTRGGATDLAEQHGLVERARAADRVVVPRVDGRLVDAVCREHGARRAQRHWLAGRRLRDALRERERVGSRVAPRALELRLRSIDRSAGARVLWRGARGHVCRGASKRH